MEETILRNSLVLEKGRNGLKRRLVLVFFFNVAGKKSGKREKPGRGWSHGNWSVLLAIGGIVKRELIGDDCWVWETRLGKY